MAVKHTSRYESYEKTYPAAIIQDWKLRVAAWESVKNKKRADCPYLEPVRSTYTTSYILVSSTHLLQLSPQRLSRKSWLTRRPRSSRAGSL